MKTRYIRDAKGTPWACVVLIDRDHVGWSMCNTRAGDRPCKQKGRMIAVNRAQIGLYEYIGQQPWQTRLLAVRAVIREMVEKEAR